MSQSAAASTRVVAYEDRPSQLVGVKLLLLSLRRHSPGLPVELVAPGAPDEFTSWVRRRVPDVLLSTDPVDGCSGYDVKPVLLEQALRRHGGMVTWIDSDIIVTADLATLLNDVRREDLVVTEEPLAMPFQGGGTRSREWGLVTERRLRATTNTAVVRVSAAHTELLETWHEFLGRPVYREAQSKPWNERPIHLMGDQEVLCALLESTEFAHVPIHFLKRGRNIAHCFHHHGYMFHQMVANLATGHRPEFVHCHGVKPWLTDEHRLHLDTSPYTLLAQEYATELDEPTEWMAPVSKGGRRMVRLARGNPWTAALPLAAYREVRDQRLIRTGVKRVLHRQ